MKVLLAIDEEPGSEEAVNEVGGRRWEESTTVRVLHVVGKFVPPAQELWYDAGGDPERARQEIKERSTELTERVGGWLREQGLTVETAERDGEPGPAVVEEAKEWVEKRDDGWTLRPPHQQPTVQYEHTLVATSRGPLILTLA